MADNEGVKKESCLRMIRWMTGLLLVLLLGCAQEPVRALKVAANQWLGYEPLFLARYIGAYEQNIDIVQLPSSTEVMRALRNGSVDVVAATLDEALLLKSQGEDLVLLMALDFSSGADVVVARPPISTLQAIQGSRVAVENTGLGALMLSAALQHAGLHVTDVELVNMSVDQHLQAYQDGTVDVVVTFEPSATQLRKAGANLLFDSSAVPDLIVDVLVCRRSVFERRDRSLRDLVRGYYKARAFMQSNPAEAAAFIGRRMQMNPLELQKAYNGLRLPSLQDNLRWLAGSPSAFETASDRLQQLMRERDLLDHSPDGQLQARVEWLQQVAP
jgi:NitT/TauT family transport system substrate-binding protein